MLGTLPGAGDTVVSETAQLLPCRAHYLVGVVGPQELTINLESAIKGKYKLSQESVSGELILSAGRRTSDQDVPFELRREGCSAVYETKGLEVRAGRDLEQRRRHVHAVIHSTDTYKVCVQYCGHHDDQITSDPKDHAV